MKNYWIGDDVVVNWKTTMPQWDDRSTIKERYEFFYVKLVELTNILCAKFEYEKEFLPLEWKLQLGRKLAEIDHNSHTWCFCDYEAFFKHINESEEPTYLGMMGCRWKTWQNNSLQPNEAIIEGAAISGTTFKARLVVDGLDFSQ